MKSLKAIFVMLLLQVLLCNINSMAQYPTRYFIKFTDKNNNTYSLGNPSAFLSARAIARRTTQGIGFDSLDLPVTQAYIDSIIAHGATVLNPTKWLNGVTIQTTDTNVLNQILALPFVYNYFPAARIGHSGNNDQPLGFLKHESMLSASLESNAANEKSAKNFDYGFGANQIQLIHGDYLHNLGYRGEGMVIAMLDAGYLNADTLSVFDSARTNNQILGTRNYVSTISNNVYQDNQHGAMCLSCIASNKPGALIGTAPHASFWLIATEDANTENIVEEYNWATGAEFADSVGADIISTSLIYTTFDHASQNHTYADMNGHTTPNAHAATIAAEKGMLVVIANGNYGSAAWNYLGTPADADSVLAVGATTGTGGWATFSSKGPSSDGRVKPDVADMGQNSTVVDPNTGFIMYGSGTSFATPTLAGSAACFWQAHPLMTNMQVREAIIQSANQYTHPDTLLGYGIPNFELANNIITGTTLVKNNQNVSVSIYPNPIANSATIFINGDVLDNEFLIVYNFLGKEIKRISIGNIRQIIFNKEQISAGMYFYKLLTSQGEALAIGKLVIE